VLDQSANVEYLKKLFTDQDQRLSIHDRFKIQGDTTKLKNDSLVIKRKIDEKDRVLE